MALRRYWIPPQRSQISSNCRGRISAPRFLDRPVSSRLSSHISMSSFPGTSKRVSLQKPNPDRLLEENKLLVIRPISEHDYNNEQRRLRRPWGSAEEMFSISDLICFLSFVFLLTFFFSGFVYYYFTEITKKSPKSSRFLVSTHEKTPPPVSQINLFSFHVFLLIFFFLLIAKTLNKKRAYRTNSPQFSIPLSPHLVSHIKTLSLRSLFFFSCVVSDGRKTPQGS